MRRLLAVIATVAAVMLPTSFAVAGDTTVADWDGVWTSVDGSDGSTQVLFVRARRGTLRFTIFDASGSVCGDIAVLGRGRTAVGDIEDDQVRLTYRVFCADGRPVFNSVEIVYDLVDGILTDTVVIGTTTTTTWRHLFG
jgi:hypothetical protein